MRAFLEMLEQYRKVPVASVSHIVMLEMVRVLFCKAPEVWTVLGVCKGSRHFDYPVCHICGYSDAWASVRQNALPHYSQRSKEQRAEGSVVVVIVIVLVLVSMVL